MSCSEICGKKGEKQKLKFNLFYGKESSYQEILIHKNCIKETLSPLMSNTQIFTQVFLQKSPMQNIPLVNHVFVVIETNNNIWWSIQKNRKYIVLKRGSKTDVLNHNRKGVFEEDNLKDVFYSMADLLNWIRAEIQQEYSLITSNCIHFSKNLLRQLTSKQFKIKNDLTQIIGQLKLKQNQ